jgi:8-hydroxy-5-deazaflavin:NADPH oxidoreductase
MEITVVGTGFIGGVVGRALATAGHDVTFASRHPDDDVAGTTNAKVTSVAEAVARPGAFILALPGNAVGEFAAENGASLEGKLVIDATNKMGGAVANARPSLPTTVRYARAFNTMGGEDMADPVFKNGQRADMFFSSPEGDRATVEEVISGVGLTPVYVGEDQEAVVDGVFQLWVALAFKQGHGRRLAVVLLTD